MAAAEYVGVRPRRRELVHSSFAKLPGYLMLRRDRDLRTVWRGGVHELLARLLELVVANLHASFEIKLRRPLL